MEIQVLFLEIISENTEFEKKNSCQKKYCKEITNILFWAVRVYITLKNRQNKGDNREINEGRKYCRMLPLEHSAILLTCISDNRS